MCRSIEQLRQPAQGPTADEIEVAALHSVRNVSGDQSTLAQLQPEDLARGQARLKQDLTTGAWDACSG